jgi:hypothetical protein
MRLLRSATFIFLVSSMLAACGGDSTSSSTTTTSPGSGSGSSTSTPVTETASIYWGTAAYDATSPVINTVLSALDADGSPIDFLDGGDFQVVLDGATEPDPEGHFNVQKLDFLTEVNGGILLMLDVSDGMAPHELDLKRSAKSLVTQAAALGLYVTVIAFDATETVLGTVAGSGDPTALNAAIDAQTFNPGTTNTYFYDILTARVTTQLGAGVDDVVYNHIPLGTPSATVELMVVMSDGIDNSGSGAASDIVTAKAKHYSILSIPVGDSPNLSELDTISNFMITTASDGGTYDQAVNDAMTLVSNLYNGFYLHDYKPTDQTTTQKTYTVTLIGNTTSSLSVTYDGPALSAATLPPLCCVLRAAPTLPVDMSNISLTALSSMDFQVVQLWGNMLQSTSVNWTFSNSDGSMTGAIDSTDPSIYTVTSNGTSGTSTLSASVPTATWSSGTFTITGP